MSSAVIGVRGFWGKVVLVMGIVICLISLIYCSTQEQIYYEGFEKGEGKSPVGWAGSGTEAKWADFGRSGRSIGLSSFNDPTAGSRWESKEIDCKSAESITVSFWAAENFVTAPEFTYCAVMSFVPIDAKLEVTPAIGSKEGFVIIERDYSLDGHFDSRGRFREPEGLRWKYYEFSMDIPAQKNKRKLVFQFQKDPVGSVYVDDIFITEGKTDETAGKKEASTQISYPFTMHLNTPVSANVFMKDDPLQFDICIEQSDKEIPEGKGVFLRYKIEDYRHILLAEGKEPFSGEFWGKEHPKYSYTDNEKKTKAVTVEIGKSIYLDETIRKRIGQLMFIMVELVVNEKILAQSEINFAIVDAYVPRKEEYSGLRFGNNRNPLVGRQIGKSWGKESPDYREKMGIFFGWNPMNEMRWKLCQLAKDSEIKFPKEIPYLCTGPGVLLLNQTRRRIDDKNKDKEIFVPEWAMTGIDPENPELFTYDIDAAMKFVKAQVDYFKNNNSHFQNAAEITNNSFYAKLQKEFYKTVKSVSPDFQVGTYWNFAITKEALEYWKKHNLLDYFDFVDTHYYAPNYNIKEIREVKKALKEMGKPKKFFTLEVAGPIGDQEVTAFKIITRQLELLAAGYDMQMWSHFSALRPIKDENDLRSPLTILEITVESNRPKISPALKTKPNKRYLPTLPLIAYYNVIQVFDLSEWIQDVHYDADTSIYVFEKKVLGKKPYSVMGLWYQDGREGKEIMFDTGLSKGKESALKVMDPYGRRHIVSTVDGKFQISCTAEPLMVEFDQKIGEIKATEPAFEIPAKKIVCIAGSSHELSCRIRNPFSGEKKFRINVIVDSRWNITNGKSLKLGPGEAGEIVAALNLRENVESGEYPVFVEVKVDDTSVALIKKNLTVKEKDIEFTAEPVPMTSLTEPAVLVRVENNLTDTKKVKVSCKSPITKERRPVTVTNDILIKPGEKGQVKFELSGLISINQNYPFDITAEYDNHVISRKQNFGFRGIVKRKDSIIIDGDLSEWDTEYYQPFIFSRNSGQEDNLSKDDLSATFQIAWDENKVYFAVKSIDDVFIGSAKKDDAGVGEWWKDNILIALYPWRITPGSKIKPNLYREHWGMQQDGKPWFFRHIGVVKVPMKDDDKFWPKEGIDLAVTRKGNITTYEWSYTKDALAPILLESGSGMSCAFQIMDRDKPEEGIRSEGLAWFSGTSHITKSSDKMGSFIFVDKDFGK